MRAGSRTLMVHVRTRPDVAVEGGPRFGLVVSKQVGNAVTRHAVSRKLRNVVLQRGVAATLPRNVDCVIRALPPAAGATSDLPEPVGVVRITCSSARRASAASSWCG